MANIIQRLAIKNADTGEEIPVDVYSCAEAITCANNKKLSDHLRELHGHANNTDVHLTAAEKAAFETQSGATKKANTAKTEAVRSASVLASQAEANAKAYTDEKTAPLTAHAASKSNPHNTTAAQVGADPAGSAALVQQNLDQHAEDKLNPHKVTCAQIGAATQEHTHSTTDITGTLPLSKGGTGATTAAAARKKLDITPANIGAAPATEDQTYPGCYYRMVGDETEWLNPPMVIGVEYRTTERWQGKPIYTKLIDCGQMPSHDKTVPHGAEASQIIKFCGQMSNGQAFPVVGSANGLAIVGLRVGLQNIEIDSEQAFYTDYTATVQIWYTKPDAVVEETE